MPHGLFPGQGIQIGRELVRLEAVVTGEPLREPRRLLARDVQLGAVAGRQNRRFARERALDLRQRLAQALDMEYHALAHRERRGLVIHSQGVEEHAA